MSYTKKIKAGLVLQDPSEFVGHAGTLFYNPDTGTMYLSDGETPGGISLGQGGGGGFSGNYNDLTHKPNLQIYATTTYVDNKTTWGNITGKPSFATVATTGNYDNLSNKPSIPSITGLATETYVTSQGYITNSALSGYALTADIPTDIANLTDNTNLLGQSTTTDRLINGSYTVQLDSDGQLLIPDNNIIFNNGTGASMYSHGITVAGNSTYAINASGTEGGIGLEWIENSGDITHGGTQAAFVLVNPYNSVGNVVVSTGAFDAGPVENNWTFDNAGNFNVPGNIVFPQLPPEILNSSPAPVLSGIVFSDGTTQTTAYMGGGSSNPFDQDLNTSNSVTFNDLTLTNGGVYMENGGDIYSINSASIDIYTDWSADQGVEVYLLHGQGVSITTNSGQYAWSFDNTGNLNLPSGGDILRDGVSVLNSSGTLNTAIAPGSTPRLVVDYNDSEDIIYVSGNWTGTTNSALGIWSVLTEFSYSNILMIASSSYDAGTNQTAIYLSTNIHGVNYTGTYVYAVSPYSNFTNIVKGKNITFDYDAPHQVLQVNTTNIPTFDSIVIPNSDDYYQIAFTNDGGVTDNGHIKVDGGTNMVIGAAGNFYVKKGSSDRITINDTETVLAAVNGPDSASYHFDAYGDFNFYYNGDQYGTIGFDGGDDFFITDSRVGGNIYVNTNHPSSGTKEWTFDFNGNITLPQGGDILDYTGTSVLGGGGSTDRLTNGSYNLVLGSDGQVTLPGDIGTIGTYGMGWPGLVSNNGYLSIVGLSADVTYQGQELSQVFLSDGGNKGIIDIIARNVTTSSLTTWRFDGDGNFDLPNSVRQTTHDSVVCNQNMDTVIYTGTDQYQSTFKILLKVEGRENGVGSWETQSCEMMVAKSFNGNKVAGTVYGLVYTSDNPLATFNARWNATSSRVEITCRPTSTVDPVNVRSFVTEIYTSD